MTYPVEERLWGTYQILYESDICKVKRLVVWPGHSLCLQTHKFRKEHWFVVEGFGIVYNNGKMKQAAPGMSFDINVSSMHKATANDDNPFVFIEVQTGISFEEEDIIRFEEYKNMDGIVANEDIHSN